MAQHFIHYVPRRIVMRFSNDPKSPWFRLDQQPGDGFDRPEIHVVSAGPSVAACVAPGDTIWIVSQIFSPWGALPPGIDCRIHVADERHATRPFPGTSTQQTKPVLEFLASGQSSWLPLANAERPLRTLATLDGHGRHSPLMKSGEQASAVVGHYLQRMRKLESADGLIAWEKDVRSRRLNFVSYRIRDGTEKAFQITHDLLRRGEAVFWDRWCLPRRLAERRERVDNAALDKHLMASLAKCERVWGVESPQYLDPTSYAAKERELGQQLGTYRSVNA